MLDRLLSFSQALRKAGVPVSVGENLDAVRSLEHIDWLDRAAWRSALATTMIKSDAHRPVFDMLFELYFDTSPSADDDSPLERAAEPEQFMAELTVALGGGDSGALQEMAERAVDQFGRVVDSPSGNLFFEYPIWRKVDTGSLTRPGEDDTLESRVANDAFDRRVAEWRRRVQAEVRRRVRATKGGRGGCALLGQTASRRSDHQHRNGRRDTTAQAIRAAACAQARHSAVVQAPQVSSRALGHAANRSALPLDRRCALRPRRA